LIIEQKHVIGHGQYGKNPKSLILTEITNFRRGNVVVVTNKERFSRLGNSLHGRDDAPMPDGAIPWVAVSPGKLYRRAQEQL
jgi:hypothetical protein